MKVRELMRTPVTTARRSTTVGSVARLLVDSGAAGVPVVDERDRLIGMVTESDLVVKHANVHGPTYLGILGGIIPFETRRQDAEMRRALGVTAGDVMTTRVQTVGPESDVDDAATLMVEEGVRTLAVVDGGRVVGTLSQIDIVRLLVAEEGADDDLAGS